MASALKDEISESFIDDLARAISSRADQFSAKEFKSHLLDGEWEGLELKERLTKVASALNRILPKSYPKAIEILISASAGFSGLPALVFPEYVGTYGLGSWSVSMKALRVFTPLSSSEFGIRPFINDNPDKAFEQLKRWTRNRDEHVRRLASEGCRILLPWAPRVPVLKQRLGDIREILEALKTDPSLYVRRSVANSLNDISKLDTTLAIEIARSWKGISADTDWVVKHAMRGLLKKGVPEVLELFGYSDPRNLGKVELVIPTDVIKMGTALEFEAHVAAKRGPLGLTRIEFIIGYIKSNGKRNEKVFQMSDGLVATDRKSMQRRISFKDLSTRKHYPGEHTIRLAVNGKRFPSKTFLLK